MKDSPKAMLVNVGGATSPAIHTLNELQPPFICFFVSPSTKDSIKTIRKALNYQPEHFDWIVTPSAQNLLSCFQALSEHLPQMLEKWEVSPEELGVDYTAATKPMSVAAVLATIDHSSQYFYVGATDSSGRDKDGIGVVLDGKERIWYQSNPWEALAVPARKEIALLFNLGRFADAQDRASRLAKLVPSEMRDVYESLAEMIEGYALWDRFEYKNAQRRLYRSRERLTLYVAGRGDPLHETLVRVDENARFLKRLTGKDEEEAARLDVLDMIANAERRAKAKRYDDAVARLYATLESIARNRLLFEYGIRTNYVKPEQIPEMLREPFVTRFSDQDQPGVVKLGLQASYQLLEALDDDLGRAYQQNEKKLSQVLDARNQSRLAHGANPIRPEIYERMKEIVMTFADVTEDALPTFPVLKL